MIQLVNEFDARRFEPLLVDRLPAGPILQPLPGCPQDGMGQIRRFDQRCA